MRVHFPKRAGGVILALVATFMVSAGCAGSSTSGAGGGAGTGRSTQTVATGNTLRQRVPASAAAARLVDQNGRSLSLRSLRGKVVVLAPLLTMCQETCPMTSENVHRAAEAAQHNGVSSRVVFLKLTVDPQRDTFRRLHAYAKLYGAMADWRLGTGKPSNVLAVWKALGVSTERAATDEPVRDWMTGKLLKHSYDVHHQDVVVIIDPAGYMRWITVGRPNARGARLPVTLHKFLNDEGRENYAHPNAGGATSWSARNLEQAVSYVLGLGGGR